MGTIEGRIFNPTTGEYLEFVRVRIDGTQLETFTDSTGRYRLTNVPAGSVNVRVFRTGLLPQTRSVTVVSGAVEQEDFNLVPGESAGQPGATVRLEQFVVTTSTEMDGAAIAINTQRFAPNSLSVVAADEFGPVANGNAGEVLRSVPGITLSLGSQGEAYQVSMNGVPPNNVPITVGGFDFGNPANGTSRGAGLHLLSINNAARIEIAYTPTPETTGSALAGTVNFVPRNAFERSKPTYSLSLGVLVRDNELNLGKTAGPQHKPQRKTQPEVMLSAVVPVNQRFGFTLSASTSGIYTPQDFIQTTWRGVGAVTNGAAFPDTTPDRPYLTSLAVRDRTSQPERRAFATTLDFKLTPNDSLSFAFQYGFSGAIQSERTLTFLINRVLPGDFTPTSTKGAPGMGELQLTNATFDVAQNLYMPSITYRHHGTVWRLEAGAGISHTTREVRSISKGAFNLSQARRQGVTVSFDDIFYLRPRVVTVTTAAGVPVDPYSIDTYSLNTANGNTVDQLSLQRNFFANARRDFRWVVPLTIKGGIDVRETVKDIRQDMAAFTFNGTDARASRVLDEGMSQRPGPFGFPSIDWINNQDLFALYQANPGNFTLNEVARYNTQISSSKHADETISAAFLRGDTQFLDGRLKLVAGIRGEQTNASGEGQLIDVTRNYRRNATGTVILGTNGRPLPITTNALETARLTRIDRGLRAKKEYLRWFPSINVSYDLRENMIARAGYYQSVGRPDLVQYAGSLTLPDTEEPASPTNRTAVNNAGIKAWTAHTVKVGLEYYFEPIGVLSVSAFLREIDNFFGDTVFAATPEFLTLYGLDPSVYGGYDVATQFNLSETSRMSGFDISYKQALTFLPEWASGVQVFANTSSLRTEGPAAANFTGFVPFTANWGVSLMRSKYNVRMRWSYTGHARRGPVAEGRGIAPGTYNWASKRMIVDLNGEYRLTPRLALFASLANLGDAPVDLQIYGSNTPEHAQFRQRQQWGAIWTFGIKGTF